jgi:hypothetical protein
MVVVGRDEHVVTMNRRKEFVYGARALSSAGPNVNQRFSGVQRI